MNELEETKPNTPKTRMPGWEPLVYVLIAIGLGRFAAWIIARHGVETTVDFTGFSGLITTIYPIALSIISFGIFIAGPSIFKRNGRIIGIILNIILFFVFWGFV